METVENAVKQIAEQHEALRAVFLECYSFTEEGGNDAYKAAVINATDVSIRLMNVLLNMRKPIPGSNTKATMDLVVGLNGNGFWNVHGGNLIPLLHIAIQAQIDYAILLAEKAQNPNITANDALISECQLVGLELFCMIAYSLGGEVAMAMAASKLKVRLAPYLS